MLGLWLELGDLVSTLGTYRASCKTLLTDGSISVHPPSTYTPFPSFSYHHILSWNMQCSLLFGEEAVTACSENIER